jgi:hypothetical protein
MAHLSLVKSLSHLQEEQKYSNEFVEAGGLRLLRGSLTEIVGQASSGASALAISVLSSLTQRGEVCGLVDVSDSFDPVSSILRGMTLENLLWVTCGGDVEKAFTATDYLIQAKGFGAIWLNLGFLTLRQMRYIPSSFWYRFRVGVNGSPTLLLVTSRESLLGSASSQAYELKRENAVWAGTGRFKLLEEIQTSIHSRKPLSYCSAVSHIANIYEDV